MRRDAVATHQRLRRGARAAEREQVERLRAFKSGRDQAQADARLEELRAACRGDENLLPPIRQALKDSCSMGEVCGAMREVFGDYQPEM